MPCGEEVNFGHQFDTWHHPTDGWARGTIDQACPVQTELVSHRLGDWPEKDIKLGRADVWGKITNDD